MSRAAIFFSLLWLLGGCSQQSATGPNAPRLPPGHASFKIRQNNSLRLSTRFNNLDVYDYLRCHHDHGSQYYIDARRFVRSPGAPVDIRTFQLFFPVTRETVEGVQATWTGPSVSLDGKMASCTSLSGRLTGSCDANLHLIGNVLTGNISCEGFNNPGGVGQFDFDVLDLLCTVN